MPTVGQAFGDRWRYRDEQDIASIPEGTYRKKVSQSTFFYLTNLMRLKPGEEALCHNIIICCCFSVAS